MDRPPVQTAFNSPGRSLIIRRPANIDQNPMSGSNSVTASHAGHRVDEHFQPHRTGPPAGPGHGRPPQSAVGVPVYVNPLDSVPTIISEVNGPTANISNKWLEEILKTAKRLPSGTPGNATGGNDETIVRESVFLVSPTLTGMAKQLGEIAVEQEKLKDFGRTLTNAVAELKKDISDKQRMLNNLKTAEDDHAKKVKVQSERQRKVFTCLKAKCRAKAAEEDSDDDDVGGGDVRPGTNDVDTLSHPTGNSVPRIAHVPGKGKVNGNLKKRQASVSGTSVQKKSRVLFQRKEEEYRKKPGPRSKTVVTQNSPDLLRSKKRVGSPSSRVAAGVSCGVKTSKPMMPSRKKKDFEDMDTGQIAKSIDKKKDLNDESPESDFEFPESCPSPPSSPGLDPGSPGANSDNDIFGEFSGIVKTEKSSAIKIEKVPNSDRSSSDDSVFRGGAVKSERADIKPSQPIANPPIKVPPALLVAPPPSVTKVASKDSPMVTSTPKSEKPHPDLMATSAISSIGSATSSIKSQPKVGQLSQEKPKLLDASSCSNNGTNKRDTTVNTSKDSTLVKLGNSKLCSRFMTLSDLEISNATIECKQKNIQPANERQYFNVYAMKVCDNYLYVSVGKGHVKRFNIDDKTDVVKYVGHNARVLAMSVYKTKNRFYTGCREGKLRSFEKETGQLVKEDFVGTSITCMDRYNDMLFVGLEDGIICRFDLSASTRKEFQVSQKPINAICALSRGILVCCGEKKLRLIAEDGNEIQMIGDDYLAPMSLDHDDTHVYAVTCNNPEFKSNKESFVRIIELETLQVVDTINLNTCCVRTLVDDKYIYCLSTDTRVLIYDKKDPGHRLICTTYMVSAYTFVIVNNQIIVGQLTGELDVIPIIPEQFHKCTLCATVLARDPDNKFHITKNHRSATKSK